VPISGIRLFVHGARTSAEVGPLELGYVQTKGRVRLTMSLARFQLNRYCGIHSIAITETGPSRSPKPIDGDHRKRFIAIGGPANLAVII
jgi:hypothetical protein